MSSVPRPSWRGIPSRDKKKIWMKSGVEYAGQSTQLGREGEGRSLCGFGAALGAGSMSLVLFQREKPGTTVPQPGPS